MPCRASYSFMRRAKEIRGLLIRETYAAISGMREMLPSAQSNFVRIFIIPHGGAGFRVWMSGLPGFYSEISTCVGSKKGLFTIRQWVQGWRRPLQTRGPTLTLL